MTPSPSVAPGSSAQKLLPGFKWDPTFSTYDGPPVVTNNGYTLGKEDQHSDGLLLSVPLSTPKGKFSQNLLLKLIGIKLLVLFQEMFQNLTRLLICMMIVCQYSAIYGFLKERITVTSFLQLCTLTLMINSSNISGYKTIQLSNNPKKIFQYVLSSFLLGQKRME